jgi:hypothetical protein
VALTSARTLKALTLAVCQQSLVLVKGDVKSEFVVGLATIISTLVYVAQLTAYILSTIDMDVESTMQATLTPAFAKIRAAEVRAPAVVRR